MLAVLAPLGLPVATAGALLPGGIFTWVRALKDNWLRAYGRRRSRRSAQVHTPCCQACDKPPPTSLSALLQAARATGRGRARWQGSPSPGQSGVGWGAPRARPRRRRLFGLVWPKPKRRARPQPARARALCRERRRTSSGRRGRATSTGRGILGAALRSAHHQAAQTGLSGASRRGARRAPGHRGSARRRGGPGSGHPPLGLACLWHDSTVTAAGARTRGVGVSPRRPGGKKAGAAHRAASVVDADVWAARGPCHRGEALVLDRVAGLDAAGRRGAPSASGPRPRRGWP